MRNSRSGRGRPEIKNLLWIIHNIHPHTAETRRSITFLSDRMSSLLTSRWVFTSSNVLLLRSVGQGKLPPPSHRSGKKKKTFPQDQQRKRLFKCRNGIRTQVFWLPSALNAQPYVYNNDLLSLGRHESLWQSNKNFRSLLQENTHIYNIDN